MPRKQRMYLPGENGEHSVLPFIGIAYMLPDRTRVVAIFEPGQYVKEDGTDNFPQPNNAAIFNADGRLHTHRGQVLHLTSDLKAV